MITRGTTPTIEFFFRKVPVERIETAWLSIQQGSENIVERDDSEAERGVDSIRWVLTQEETLAIRTNAPCLIQCRWKTDMGSAGASRIYTEHGAAILMDGVI